VGVVLAGGGEDAPLPPVVIGGGAATVPVDAGGGCDVLPPAGGGELAAGGGAHPQVESMASVTEFCWYAANSFVAPVTFKFTEPAQGPEWVKINTSIAQPQSIL
jgi:hypothetical protein